MEKANKRDSAKWFRSPPRPRFSSLDATPKNFMLAYHLRVLVQLHLQNHWETSRRRQTSHETNKIARAFA